MMNGKKNLSLNKAVIPNNPSTPEEAAMMMATFNSTMMDLNLNMLGTLSKISTTLEEIRDNQVIQNDMLSNISVDTDDLVQYTKKQGLYEEWISQLDINEQEKDPDDGVLP